MGCSYSARIKITMTAGLSIHTAIETCILTSIQIHIAKVYWESPDVCFTDNCSSDLPEGSKLDCYFDLHAGT